MKEQKPYFAKNLPVEGEVKEGQFFALNHEGKLGRINNHTYNSLPHRFTPVKLFLYSRNIQVGDEVRYRGFYNGENRDESVVVTRINNSEISMSNGYSTPIESDGECLCLNTMAWIPIGEISPETTWVKEGDEFEKDEVAFTLIFDKGTDDEEELDVSEEDYIKATQANYQFSKMRKEIKLKGPCGHFH